MTNREKEGTNNLKIMKKQRKKEKVMKNNETWRERRKKIMKSKAK